MKYILLILSVFLFAACDKNDDNNPAPVTQSFTAALNGTSAIPTNSSSAKGLFTGTYSSTTQTLNFTITYSGTTPTAWDIHLGATGVEGPVEFPLGTVTASPYSGSINNITAAQLNNFTAGLYYVNIISAGFPDGELRGQIVKQ